MKKIALILIALTVILFSCGDKKSTQKEPVFEPPKDSAYRKENRGDTLKPETGLKLGARKPMQIIIAPNGNDANAGTLAKPIHSLLKAWSMAIPDDTIYLRGGGPIAYSKSQYLQGKNGTPGHLIKIWNYPGEKPLITISASYNGNVEQDLIYLEGEYLHFKGIEIAHYKQKPGVYAWPAFRAGFLRYSIIEQMDYHHNATSMSIRNATGNTIINNDFHHNQDPYSSSPYDGADGLAVHYVNGGATNLIRGNRAWGNTDDGIDLWDNNGYVEVDSNWCWNNGYIPDTYETAGNGTGFKLGSTGSYPSKLLRKVTNNIAVGNRSYGFCENSAICKSDIINNTAVGNGDINYWFGAWSSNVSTLKSNISWKSKQLTRLSDQVINTGNSWNGKTVSASDFENSVDTAQLRAPRKADGSLPGLSLYRVKETSPLFGMGARFTGEPGGGDPDPDPDPIPVDTTWKVYAPLNQYDNKTADNRAKPNANKKLEFSGTIYRRGEKEFKVVVKPNP